VLALICLDRKKDALAVVILGVIPVLIGTKADGHLGDVSWTTIMIIPIIVAGGITVFGLTYTFIAIKQKF